LHVSLSMFAVAILRSLPRSRADVIEQAPALAPSAALIKPILIQPASLAPGASIGREQLPRLEALDIDVSLVRVCFRVDTCATLCHIFSAMPQPSSDNSRPGSPALAAPYEGDAGKACIAILSALVRLWTLVIVLLLLLWLLLLQDLSFYPARAPEQGACPCQALPTRLFKLALTRMLRCSDPYRHFKRIFLDGNYTLVRRRNY